MVDLKDANRLPIQTIAQCYGKQISAKCQSQHLMRIVSATYLRSRDCVGGASDLPLLGGGNESLTTGCSRDNVSGPPCVGNGSCIFTAPWIYISANCGYSNYFSLRYQCVPGMHWRDQEFVLEASPIPDKIGVQTMGFRVVERRYSAGELPCPALDL